MLSVLLQENKKENYGVPETISRAIIVVEIVRGENVAVACLYNGEQIFCGIDNGAVALYFAKTGREIRAL